MGNAKKSGKGKKPVPVHMKNGQNRMSDVSVYRFRITDKHGGGVFEKVTAR